MVKMLTKRDEKDTETIDWVEEVNGEEYKKSKKG